MFKGIALTLINYQINERKINGYFITIFSYCPFVESFATLSLNQYNWALMLIIALVARGLWLSGTQNV